MRFSVKYIYPFMVILSGLILILSISNCSDQASEIKQELSTVDEYAGNNQVQDEYPVQAKTVSNDNDLDWCAEHAVPESECTKCNPSLIAEFKNKGDWCDGHDLPESHCRLCNPNIRFPQEDFIKTNSAQSLGDQLEITLNFSSKKQTCATDGALIQFASASTAQRAGLSLQQVVSSPKINSFDAPAEIVFDETEINIITTTVPALVVKWVKTPGDVIKTGEILAILQSPEIAEMEAGLLKTFAAYNVQKIEQSRNTELKQKKLISDSEYEQQEALTEQTLAELTSAKGLLLSAGLTEDDIANLIETKTVSSKFVLRAQSDGALVQRLAQIGKLLEAGSAYAMIANPQAMWVEAQLTEQQLRLVQNGNHITFSSDGRGIDQTGAIVIWVSQYLDPHSRTGTVRAKIIDSSVKLQAGEFGLVTITADTKENTLLIPKDAVQWEGCCNVVFVKESDLRYRPHKVNLNGSVNNYYQASGNIKDGDEIVVNGSFLLKTELKKTSIGAGCCGLEPIG